MIKARLFVVTVVIFAGIAIAALTRSHPEVLKGVSALRAETRDELGRMGAFEIHPFGVIVEADSGEQKAYDLDHCYTLSRDRLTAYKEATKANTFTDLAPKATEDTLEFVLRSFLGNPTRPSSGTDVTHGGQAAQKWHFENSEASVRAGTSSFLTADLIIEKVDPMPLELRMRKVHSTYTDKTTGIKSIHYSDSVTTFRYDLNPIESIDDYLKPIRKVVDVDAIRVKYIAAWKNTKPVAQSGGRELMASWTSPNGWSSLVFRGAKPNEFSAVDQEGRLWLLFGQDRGLGYSEWSVTPLEPTNAPSHPVLTLTFSGGKPFDIPLPSASRAVPEWAPLFSYEFAAREEEFPNWRADYYENARRPKDQLRWLRVELEEAQSKNPIDPQTVKVVKDQIQQVEVKIRP